MMSELPNAPWRIDDQINDRKNSGYIGIRGPNGEKICDIFPFAGIGGVGAASSRKIAELIITARLGRS